MNFEVGKFYKTRGGHKAQIFMLDNGNGWMYGALCADKAWGQYSWRYDTGKADYGTLNYENDIVGEWKEPVKPKLLAPALYRDVNGKVFITSQAFESKEEARKACGDHLVQWPAKVTADGFYEVMSDE